MLSGNLRKMITTLTDDGLVYYQLSVGDHQVPLNELIGQALSVNYQGEIHCIHCGRLTKKSFQQGYCYPCLAELNDCDLCMIHPVRCHSQHAPCDDTHWVHASCNQPHIVYLANSSGLKVGVTRVSQIPTRWIDQGAVQALPIFLLSNRYQAGLVEQALSEHVNDKTNWRVMLKGSPQLLNLTQLSQQLLNTSTTQLEQITHRYSPEQIRPYPDAIVVEINYPVHQYPSKITSFNLDTAPQVSGTLLGIKGQYLIFDTGVINLRKFSGYKVEFTIL